MSNNLKPQNKAPQMAALLEKEDDAIKVPQIGELIEGTVISIGSNEVQLDIHGLTTGVVRGKELQDESGEATDLSIGDQIAATVIDVENENGEVEMSFRHAGHQKAWNNLEELMDSGKTVKARIIDANKGGLMVKVGNVVGFLPVSQLTTEHYPRVEGGDKNKILAHLKEYIGDEFKVQVIDVNEAEEKLIVSEKAAWEEKQQEILSEYNVGDVVEGRITGVVDFGAFIEFGDNLEGLIHISELDWQRIDDPRDIVHVGDNVKAEIIAIEDSKISLSMKKLKKDPWASVTEKYKVGQTVEGKVLKVSPFGAFVELDEDIHGLAHISELAEREIEDPSDKVEVGETYKFTIISIEPEDHRLGLSLIKDKSDVKPKADKKSEKTEENKSTDEDKSTDEETDNESSDDQKNETEETKKSSADDKDKSADEEKASK